MRKITILAFIALTTLAQAQTQNGFVRTASRPDKQSERLQGVIVRVRGSHNPVMSAADGAFQLLLPGTAAGDGYVIAGVNKAGYELREPELIGRTQPFSEKVPLEIVMLSRQQLMQDKMRIEQKARENIERYYNERLEQLNEQLVQAKLSNAQFEQQLSQLEQQYERFEPLIAQMSERYARTDYDQLDAAGVAIQQAIEEGNLDEAQQLILKKGSPEDRERKLRRIQQEAAFQLNDLAQDYYNLYTIHLSRFENDSALYYLVHRAQLDSTNAAWQLEAGEFIELYQMNYDEALVYYQRALRQANRNEGERSANAAKAHNNIASSLIRVGQYEQALDELDVALPLYEEIYGADHPYTAARQMNIGIVYYHLGKYDRAMRYFRAALNAYKNEDNNSGEDYTQLKAELENNIAAVCIMQGKLDEAETHLQDALHALPEKGQEYYQVMFIKALGYVKWQQSQKEAARSYWKQAADLAHRTLGEEHPFTKECDNYLKSTAQ